MGVNMNFLIRRATINDWEAALGIMQQVQQMHVAWRPDIYKPNDNILPVDVFAKSAEEGRFFVAEADGTVVGIMEIIFRHIENRSHAARNVIFIDSMAVDEQYRGMGIGHLFFEKAKQLKDQKQCDGIELQVNAKNKAAYKMYRKYGFTKKSINMELR